ncbi:DUF397 domain-containing protein [Actinomadura logoneensis]|uniref:DUF397 domain-containing protein n=1 Tax=Actinomadura logoneensis TaxID=2293572 RepID=A0A372JS81_9ACTN|nr:DUF397 domain-containing protein [Actinomadura logoneensis]RFU42799.1 DUF397 domain-containing protein [Actinomadura logoneensis]
MSQRDARWRKSSYSGDTGSSTCVEVAALEPVVGIRDSKAPEGLHLPVSRDGFADLLGRLR